LTSLGVERVDTLRFTHELAHQTPSEFVGWLHRTYPFRMLWVGSDFALGRDRAGTVATLSELGRSVGFEVIEVEPLMERSDLGAQDPSHDRGPAVKMERSDLGAQGPSRNPGPVVKTEGDRPISSTWVRELLKAGDLEGAAKLLGHPYCLEGPVIEGARRGRQLGFPTANVMPAEGWALPPDGVYFVRVEVAGQDLPGVANLGSRPTFNENQRLLEAHLLDYEGDLYGRDIRVCFVEQIRPIQKFDSLDDLRAQIQRDVEWGRAKAAEARPRAPATGS
jgi:riboflavin kinase/FMN adenylyltransferase